MDFKQQLAILLPYYSSKKFLKYPSKAEAVKHLIPIRTHLAKYGYLLWCYAEGKPRIRIITKMKEGSHVILFNGYVEGTQEQVIIKWYSNPGRGKDTNYENEMYRRLGYPTPCWSTEYEILGTPVLVMRPMDRLSQADDPYEVGIAVLKQLKPLHKFGCHNDIKPDNIMKEQTSEGIKYYLIDYGGCAVEREEDGYNRWILCPDWPSQPRRSDNGGRKVITFPKYDLIELGYTMKGLYIKRKSGKKWISDDVRSGFGGRLGKYMKIVNSLDDELILDPTIIDNLIKILSERA